MKAAPIALLVASIAGVAVEARAHHVVTEHGLAPVVPRTLVAIEGAAATFDAGGRRGRWQALTPAIEWRFVPRLSIMAALPLAHISQEAEPERFGIGDLALSAKIAVLETPHGGLLLSLGLGAELPTGDPDAGLGGGHVELAPFVAASSALYDGERLALITYGNAALRLSIGAADHAHGPGVAPHAHAHGSVLAPHASRELHGRLMLAAVTGSVYIALGGEGAGVLAGDGPGHLAARLELGWLVTEAVRLFVAGDLTVAGEDRYGARAAGGAAWLF